MANKKTWTDENIQYLADNFATGNLEQISNIINKSIDAINKRAGKLGLKRESEWSKEDKLLLKKLYPKTDNDIIALKLGKTESAVRNMAVKLKLKKSKYFWTISQEKYLLQNWGVIEIEDMMKHLGKTYWSVTNKYRELAGLRKTGDKIIMSKIKNAG